MKKIVLTISILFLSILLVGCERENASLSLNKGTTTMHVGDTETLVVTVKHGDESDITWSSDDTNIATVDKSGKVTALKEGLTKVRASLSSGIYVACEIIVNDDLADLKAQSIKEINNLVASLNSDNYSSENWLLIQSYSEIGKGAIETLTDEDSIKEIKDQTLSAIRSVQTNELKKAKDDAIAEINSHVSSLDKGEYQETDWLKIVIYQLEAFIKINDAKNIIDITTIKNSTITSIDLIPTVQ